MSLAQFTESNVMYTKQFYTKCEADKLLKELLESPFCCTNEKNSTAIAFGDAGLSYTFKGAKVQPEPWNPILQKLRDDVQKATCCEFNLAHVNLYPDKNSDIEDHKYDDFSLDPSSSICILSFGAKRSLDFKQEQCETTEIELEHGSMCVIYPSSNELFNHSIPSVPNEKDPHVNITFAKMCIYQPSAKKPKMEDWVDHLYPSLFTPSNNTWHLGELTYVSLHDEKNNLQIYIRQFIEIAPYDYSLTSHGVMLQPSTFMELSEKLAYFHPRYKNDSFICNNQLSVLNEDGKCILQEIYKTGDYFALNPTFLKLTTDQVLTLCEIRSEICEYILKTLFTITLPHFILILKPQKCHHELHCEREQAKYQLMDFVAHELIKNVNLEFNCTGCVENHPSQRMHTCLSTMEAEKYLEASEKVWFMLDIPYIAREICNKKCTCLYDGDFFSYIFLEDFRNHFKIVLMNSFYTKFPYYV